LKVSRPRFPEGGRDVMATPASGRGLPGGMRAAVIYLDCAWVRDIVADACQRSRSKRAGA